MTCHPWRGSLTKHFKSFRGWYIGIKKFQLILFLQRLEFFYQQLVVGISLTRLIVLVDLVYRYKNRRRFNKCGYVFFITLKH